MGHRQRINLVRAAIGDAERAARRPPGSVRLLSVSKTRSVAEIRAVHAAGVADFGENYAQEGVAKALTLADLDITWHFIGAIQANKTRDIARYFQWVHSVDRMRVASRLNAAAERPVDVCVQVNVDAETGKAGVAPHAAAALVEEVAALPRLRLRGLMAIPSPQRDPRPGFQRLRALFDALSPNAPAHWDTLSMGMSADYPAAIEHGATIVRVGTALFGPRPPKTAGRDAARPHRNTAAENPRCLIA